jgi:hypothetical protein
MHMQIKLVVCRHLSTFMVLILTCGPWGCPAIGQV